MRTTETTRRFRVSFHRSSEILAWESLNLINSWRNVVRSGRPRSHRPSRISKRFLRFPCDLPTANSETVTPMRPCVPVKIKRDASITDCVVRYMQPTTNQISNQSGFTSARRGERRQGAFHQNLKPQTQFGAKLHYVESHFSMHSLQPAKSARRWAMMLRVTRYLLCINFMLHDNRRENLNIKKIDSHSCIDKYVGIRKLSKL